jgi:hypothetical protein
LHDELDNGIKELEVIIMEMKELSLGDEAFDKAINLEASIQMDYTYCAIDSYNNSLQHATKLGDEDVKAECRAKLGRAYSKILLNKEKARVYLYEAVSYGLKVP